MTYSHRESPVLAQLCTLLVEDVYGELAARVFSVLARHGRQTLAALARASYLTGRQIKYGLVILLQQHLAFHSGSDAPTTYYEIDWGNAYALVRVGKVAKLVEDRFGKKAANVTSNLLTLGHTRISDLREAYFPTQVAHDGGSEDDVNGIGLKQKQSNGVHINGDVSKVNGVGHPPVVGDSANLDLADMVNGDSKLNGVHKQPTANGTALETVEGHGRIKETDSGEFSSVDDLYNIIQRLMERGWVRAVTPTQYLSPGDMHDVLRQAAIETTNGGAIPTGVKDKAIVEAETVRLKRDMRDEWSRVPHISKKRPADDSYQNGPNKRAKMNGATNGVAASVLHPEDDLVIRVNPEKIAVAMRTEQLVHLVEQRLGYVTARVYEVILRMLEPDMPRCFEEWPDVPSAKEDSTANASINPEFLFFSRDVAKKLDRYLDLCEGLDPNAIIRVVRRGHVRSLNVLSQPVNPAKLTLEEKTRLVEEHIQLLCDDPIHFLTWFQRGQWSVEFGEIAKHLIQAEVESTVAARKGPLGVKLIRALRKKGRLDERATCIAMMMSAADIRGHVNDLTVQGFVQTQEIPKVERREAKHSIHLIWYDRQRAREKLLYDTYKGMVRILQRIAFEREKVQPLLAKAERSDVVGNEEKWLSKGELDALRKWKEVQERLLLQLFREDDLVATLRDFHGPLVSA